MNSRSKSVGERDAVKLPGERRNHKLQNPPSALVKVDLAAQSHAGSSGVDNQDYYLAVRLERSLRTMLSNFPAGVLPACVEEAAYGMAVADGLSGMPAGALASSLALQKLVDLVAKTPDWIMRMNRRKAAVVKRRMIQRYRQIDIALREQSDRDPRTAGLGTTLTVACSLGADLFLAHIGDSRAYILRDGELTQLTHDHTLAQAMIDAGVAGAEDAVVHGMRRVLTQALGSPARPCDPQVHRLFLRNRDQLLLCTDGLIESVDAKTIASILLSADSAGDACRRLVNQVLSSDGYDNVTVVLARYSFPETASSPSLQVRSDA